MCESRLNNHIQFLSKKSVRKNDYSEDKKKSLKKIWLSMKCDTDANGLWSSDSGQHFEGP